MREEIEKKLDARYRNHFGYLAGYLPKDRARVDAWQKALVRRLDPAKPFGPAVKALAELIALDGVVRLYVTQMIEQQPADHQTVSSIETLLAALNHIATTAPAYTPGPDQIDAFPMSNLFTYMMMTTGRRGGVPQRGFNDAIALVLREWCAFLDSPDSRYVLNEGDARLAVTAGLLVQQALRVRDPRPRRRRTGDGRRSTRSSTARSRPRARPIAERRRSEGDRLGQ